MRPVAYVPFALATGLLVVPVLTLDAGLPDASPERASTPAPAAVVDGAGSAGDAPATSQALLDAAAHRAETRRVARHLGNVEAELAERDVSHLTEEQREARRERIDHLREYRERQRFPLNLDFPDERVPYFRDARGTLCAVAYLLHRSGETELVDRIARERNHATVRELADEEALVEWLEASGLSLAEAGRIQPMYECTTMPCLGPAPEPEDELSGGYVSASVATAALGGLGAGVALTNPGIPADRRWPAVLAMTAGATGIGLGAARLGDSGAPRTVGAVNAALGSVSLGVGVLRLLRAGADRTEGGESGAAGPEAEDQAERAVELVPVVTADGGAGGAIRLTF